MSIVPTVNAGPRLDRLPISGFHRRLLCLIGAGVFVDAFDVYLAGGAMAKMVDEAFSTIDANAGFLSAGFAGMLFGALIAGLVGDRFGRRYSYQFNLLIFGLASLGAVFAPSIETLTVLRFMMGIGLGAEVVVASGALLEFIPPSHRGRSMALLAIIINSGFLASTVVGYFVIPAFGWRWMFAIAGLGALAVWVARKGMPESPRWLESVGRKEEAEQALAAIEATVQKERGALPPVAGVERASPARVPVSALFASTLLPRTILGALIAISTLAAVFNFILWLPTFMVKEGLSVVESLGFSMAISLGAPLGGVVAFWIADRVPRKQSLVATSVSIVVLGTIYPTLESNAVILIVGFALVTAIYALVALGVYTYVPELFPTAIRLRGTGFCSLCGRAASIAMPFAAVVAYRNAGLTGVLMIVCGLLVLLIGAVLVVNVETLSRPLEDIGGAGDAIGSDAAPKPDH
ncbi:MFS transporter [Paraburkholderia sp. J12]|uniref:MFS transporter n=1 Tax=Paraburkholderia sp. J12 TaxID=2805432 RepID=UPI002ABDDCA4|nr:MFS transporter [Paraburkholderia sp. J12]